MSWKADLDRAKTVTPHGLLCLRHWLNATLNFRVPFIPLNLPFH